jgi:hypothetical protein
MADATTLAAMLQKANDATPEEAKKIYQKIIAEGQGAWAIHIISRSALNASFLGSIAVFPLS